MQNLIVAVLSALSLSPGQKFRECSEHLGLSSTRAYSTSGILLGRPSTEFTRAEVQAEAADRVNVMPDAHWIIARGADPAARLLTTFAEDLADRSNLRRFLNNPEPLVVYVERSGHEGMPRANLRAGIMSINRAMIDLVATDDELAEIIGHELLHQTLAHGLVLSRARNKPLLKALRFGTSISMFSGRGESIRGELAAAALTYRGRAIEKEAHDAIGVLLENANYDQWAIVSLWEKQRQLGLRIGRPFFDHHADKHLIEIIDRHRARLDDQRVLPRTQHSTAIIDRLKELLNASPARDEQTSPAQPH